MSAINLGARPLPLAPPGGGAGGPDGPGGGGDPVGGGGGADKPKKKDNNSYSDRVRRGHQHEENIRRSAGNVTGINGKGLWHGELYPSFGEATKAKNQAIKDAIAGCHNRGHIHSR